MLAQTPPRIAELTVGLTPVQLQAAPSPGAWSAHAVLAHLRACADVWGDCIVTILTHDTPTIRAVNPTTWIKDTPYLEQAFHPSLHAFTAQRTALLALLEPLRPDGWARAATVTGAGKPLVRTIQGYAQWLASHERPHVKQIQHVARTLRMEH
jgi:hypothetical protein